MFARNGSRKMPPGSDGNSMISRPPSVIRSPAVERIAQEGIISSRLADRHFPRIADRFIGQECAIVDVLDKFFRGPSDHVAVRIQLEEMDDLDAQPFHFSAQGDLRFFRKVGDLSLEAQLQNVRGMKYDLLSQVPHFFTQCELRRNSIEIVRVDHEQQIHSAVRPEPASAPFQKPLVRPCRIRRGSKALPAAARGSRAGNFRPSLRSSSGNRLLPSSPRACRP